MGVCISICLSLLVVTNPHRNLWLPEVPTGCRFRGELESPPGLETGNRIMARHHTRIYFLTWRDPDKEEGTLPLFILKR